MSFNSPTAFLLGSLLTITHFSADTLSAGCPCQKGLASSPATAYSAPVQYPEQYTGGYTGSDFQPGVAYDPALISNGPTPAENFQNGSLSVGQPQVGPGFSRATQTTWQPPPGTLGRTYQIKSRPVPVSMHPRAAIVDVIVKDAKEVRVHDMNAYRTQDYLDGFQDHEQPDVWHFTSEPLIPGLSHIYRIEARFEKDGKKSIQERYVRLIMGRVIEMEF